ncbi:glycosyltransferase [Flavobacterium agricola]|uniref:Glycosyltransferase n=1 Tax=Flavobacterium agricola TaxID=2870839 RepID=A0ABY6LXA7_9FLAO|nr:glycosyltransferase [Flavobacterium agricola]UYW00965.1 glycosyltransferase [Flavobacterium agricola]
MVVVHIVEAFGGGVYTYLKDLTEFFSKSEDVKNIIIYSTKRKEFDKDKMHFVNSNNVEYINIDMERSVSPLQDFKSILKIRKILNKIKPDVVHMHSSKAGILGRFASLGIVSNTKTFYSPHGYSFLNHEFSPTKKKMFYFIEKYSQNILGGTTVACGDTEYEIASKIGKSVLVRNGIIPDHVVKYKNEVTNNRLLVGTLGRISLQKNPKLFNEIAIRFPDFDFLWIGEGDLKDQLTAPNITVTGWLTNRDIIMNKLNKLDIYIQTSSWEGLPISIIEAMALSKPVVATNIIGNKDLVSNQETGFVFTDLNELDEIFEKLKAKETRLFYGQNGYKRCSLLFNSQINFNQLSNIYKNG